MQIVAHGPTPLPALDTVDRLEQSFLEDFLKHYRHSDQEDSFTGGYAEAHFEGFLNQEYAAFLARKLDLKLGLDDDL